jgi:hypothetical protein
MLHVSSSGGVVARVYIDNADSEQPTALPLSTPHTTKVKHERRKRKKEKNGSLIFFYF